MFPERSGEGLCFRHTRGPLFGYLQLNEKIYLNNYGDGSYSM